MAESTGRERIVMMLLLPAIVAAVVVLLAYMFRASLQLEQVRQRSVIEATLSLTNEKVDRLDRLVIDQDNVISTEVDAAEPQTVGRRWLPIAARETPTVRAVLVIDLSSADRQVLGYASRTPGPEDESFRRLVLGRMFADLDLSTAPDGELRHLHKPYGGQSYLVSYWQRMAGGRRYLVVAWHQVASLVHDVFPRLFADPSGASRTAVVDEEGRQVYGASLRASEFTVGRPFPTTLYGWRLQVALNAADELGQRVERRRLLELGLVTTACVVIILGVGFVLFAVVKERRLSEQKSEFVANVSHELKTPLSLVRMFAELLMTGRVASEEKRKQYLEIMVLESERLTALIENVLDFARADRGKATLDRAPSDLGEVAQRAVDIYRYRAEREDVRVELTVEPELPEVPIDPRAMELVVINLLDNALKYAKDGKRIAVAVGRAGQHLEVSVTDEGPGIPRAEQRRIFDRFVRGTQAEGANVRGTGIGLSLVKRIAEEHGGYARVVSEPGHGARFVVGVPLEA